MKNTHLDKVAINVYSRKILHTILEENPVLERILRKSTTEKEAARSVRDWIQPMLKRNPAAESFYFSVEHNHELFQELDSRDFAVIFEGFSANKSFPLLVIWKNPLRLDSNKPALQR